MRSVFCWTKSPCAILKNGPSSRQQRHNKSWWKLSSRDKTVAPGHRHSRMSAEPGSEHKRPTEGPQHSCDIHRNAARTSCTASEWKHFFLKMLRQCHLFFHDGVTNVTEVDDRHVLSYILPLDGTNSAVYTQFSTHRLIISSKRNHGETEPLACFPARKKKKRGGGDEEKNDKKNWCQYSSSEFCELTAAQWWWCQPCQTRPGSGKVCRWCCGSGGGGVIHWWINQLSLGRKRMNTEKCAEGKKGAKRMM